MQEFLSGRVTLHEGDCIYVLRKLANNSVDSVVTDPPYELGFMNRKWDATGIAFRPYLWAEARRVLKPGGHIVAFSGTRTYHRMACAIEDAGFEIRDQLAWVYASGFPKSHNIGNGLGTALKPAWECIALARKPLSEPTIAANVLRWGTGAINVDGCRVPKAADDRHEYGVSGDEPSVAGAGASGTMGRVAYVPSQSGRWPANLCHDGSEEVLTGFRDPDAARFYYTAKADGDDRLGSKHPTVKPLDLIQWLCRLITPPHGTILDMFAGTGTTGEAAFREGFKAILVEREAEYCADIARRMSLVLGGPVTRKNASVKARGRVEDAGPLFAVGEAAE